jgi:hypothetical protein
MYLLLLVECKSCLNNGMYSKLFNNNKLIAKLWKSPTNRSLMSCHSCVRPLLINNRNNYNKYVLYSIQTRNIVTAVRLLRSVLKIRYILLGSAVGGGVHMSKVSINSINWFSIYINIYLNYLLIRNTKNGKKVFRSLNGSKICQNLINWTLFAII